MQRLPRFTAEELADLEAELEDRDALDRALQPQLEALDRALAEGDELLVRSRTLNFAIINIQRCIGDIQTNLLTVENEPFLFNEPKIAQK